MSTTPDIDASKFQAGLGVSYTARPLADRGALPLGSDWRQALGRNNRGSRPRCIALVDGTPESVAASLTDLVHSPGIDISPTDFWLPWGKPTKRGTGWDARPAREARLERDAGFVPDRIRRELRDWWLAVPRGANTPNWDLAATCTVADERGLVLVEAKAHQSELSAAGKALPTTANGWKNHDSISAAIAQANAGLRQASGGRWALSRDHHYQLSNRFAWAWKLASTGVPVVLVYLGFLDADDMATDSPLFHAHDNWVDKLKCHANGIVDDACWDRQLDIAGVSLSALIRTCRVPLPPP